MEISQPGSPVIRTPDQRVRVFVSSTLKEMANERVSDGEAIDSLRMAPVMFEVGARPHQAQSLYRAYLEQSHIFIGIYGGEYGWVGPNMSISGLEDEYRLAKDKPRFVYIKKPVPDRDPRLTQMLTVIRDRDGISYKYFSSADELRELIRADLSLFLAESFETAHSTTARPETTLEPRRLPVSTVALVGRDSEVERSCQIVSSGKARLLTFTGPGGSGKTRLSIEVANRLAADFEFACFVELATISDPDLVVDAVAHTVGIREIGAKSAPVVLKEFLFDKRALLLLDNFEQVVEASPMISDVLETCPGVTFLVTSRTTLNIRGEQEFPVQPLAVPEHSGKASVEDLLHFAAVTLFCQRAQAVKPDFVLGSENAVAVAQICRNLGGLPLAIELTAPCIRFMSPTEMLKRMERGLPLSNAGGRDLPERQKTMRNTIAWSYDLLDAPEAQLFRRLAVFSGGSTFDAASVVGLYDHDTDAAVDVSVLLNGLVSKNLVRYRENRDGESRFEMLETIREFAFEKLDESGERAGVLQEHAAFFTQLTETAEPHMTSGRRDVWLARLEEEIDNIRIVMSRSLSDLIDPMFGIRVAGTLGWFWHLHGHVSEAGRWATSMLTLPQAAERSRERAKVLFSAGGSAWLQGNYATANAILEESAALLREIGDPRGLTDARVMLVGGLAGVGEIDRALGICEETLLLLRQADDSWGIAFTLTWYGAIVMVRNGDAVLARSMFEESRTLAKELNDPWLHAEALNHLGFAESWQGNFETAVSYFQESLSYHEATGDRWATARALSGYGETALRRGETEEAKRLFCRSALIWREMGNRPGTLACLFGLAQIAGAEQEWVRSARLFGAAPTPVRVVGYLFLTVAASEYSDCVERVRDALGDELWMKERENGTSMSLEEAVTYAFDDTETEP